MRLATVKDQGEETAAIIMGNQVVMLQTLNEVFNTTWPVNLYHLLESGKLTSLAEWFENINQDKLQNVLRLSKSDVTFAPPYRHPRKIWGIGLNYVEHASDLHEMAPNSEPASFMKPDTAIIGLHDTIQIPHQSERTTAEAELGIIIGKECRNVTEKEAIDYVAGYTTVIDMTAEDILQRNPRYLTRSKSFDTFFSFGPELVTTDEVEDVHQLEVSTRINGNLHRKNIVSNMTFTPWNLISFHSKVMTLLPGDIISTGTPGAVVIRDGDVVSCVIDGFALLENRVEDVKQ
ncbi:2-keto-4-pentenoate hydratase/2-oxohepta-3-ene-1,7-dioic acid hydratase (catechol pathway) [Salinibacillus kushneri]|uniref:2-keto-4-pentenoate hydratase/2-oxohepta-3-ene-1,7-dioic acid hydratase (Catechol pathway) n=1 Tax=Salinibacillus kushneri TaxID=237682 RepID=A0A1H9YVW8_9BACI|nr:fumarylacetoacetate hydrolase family protein [Salinibacillus kushneri]SES73294.1 2-keto-4-pentenoate hydratase/2-oxohepta-3-ene-1,7-dioic acid hydratase (catechol pathway) [Salinibacillus kushneri]